ncbi:MAG: N-acetylmuramic acid 6-phosphate etherase [Vicingaceae bacterium]
MKDDHSNPKITESASHYDGLENMGIADVLLNINKEDQRIAEAVGKVIPVLETFLPIVIGRMKNGGRLFYTGAGTSGRLGILDASECPPTFGVDHGLVIGLIAGGDSAIRKAVEFAEDDPELGWKDLLEYGLEKQDTVIGIAASGTTPYVIGGLKSAKEFGCLTACICCNQGSPLSKSVEYPIEVVVGPEFVTGSTRMKSGTAQKMVLNMISTSVMIGLGRIKGNKMVDMQLSNNKLINRGIRMIMDELSVDEKGATALLKKHGSVRNALLAKK